MRYGRSFTVQPDRLKGRVMCGNVYGDMHFNDLLESNAIVGYRVPVPGFYLVLHGLRCRKGILVDQSIIKSYLFKMQTDSLVANDR